MRPALAARIRALIPTLTTDRLILRAPAIEDYPVYLDISTSPRSKGIGGPFERGYAWLDFAQLSATWLWRGHGAWTVVRRHDGQVVGFVLIGFEPGDGEPELGYIFTEAGEGQGFAKEAARAAMAYARDHLGMTTLVSYIYADNLRSLALAERLGGTRDVPADGHAAGAPPPSDDATHTLRYDLRTLD